MNNIIKQELITVLKELNLIFDESKIIISQSSKHADFTSNIALILAAINKLSPMELAEQISQKIKTNNNIAKVEVAKPGFINFFISNQGFVEIIQKIIKEDDCYGSQKQNKKINIEFVSANPTGFLHLGHLRSAIIGDVLARVLEFSGNQVLREYYINDFGVQVDRLTSSLIARYDQIFDKNVVMPQDSYVGEDIVWGANKIYLEIGDKFQKDYKNEDKREFFWNKGLQIYLDEIKKDLTNLDIFFDKYSSEAELHKNSIIKTNIKKLPGTYEQDGALWLKTSQYGDDKDRVLIKQDGKYTYFGADICYHLEKINSSFHPDLLINIWGADHIGYVDRIKSALSLVGEQDKLYILLYQLVKLLKNGQEFKMSKRKGSTFTIKDILKLADKDSIRYFMVERSENSIIEFDIEKVNQINEQNPLFIIQYAYARSYQLLEKIQYNFNNISSFNTPFEIKLINELKEFEVIIAKISHNYKINLLNKYLLDLANSFNSFYSNVKILDSPRKDSLMAIVKAVNIVIRNGLKLLGIQGKEKV
ncbi:Arginyl-tRNA synthetase [Mesomycoplasma conjunctivae]|uniref:arginine--tRNA ligase n=1 Tax=Mesomycoplasma conjunctivae TaxID=45361 RepID=UPI0002D6F7FD|nr:arginine--tRNA ligase [Mesomycoplasma conjunctivae]VEU65918.1 Arginyl-tRNA synthetase [Mesomycoplasma conjunctivae]